MEYDKGGGVCSGGGSQQGLFSWGQGVMSHCLAWGLLDLGWRLEMGRKDMKCASLGVAYRQLGCSFSGVRLRKRQGNGLGAARVCAGLLW